jgi:hypothetical protein
MEEGPQRNNHNYLVGSYRSTPSEMGCPSGQMLTVIHFATVSSVVYLNVISILWYVNPLKEIKPVKVF